MVDTRRETWCSTAILLLLGVAFSIGAEDTAAAAQPAAVSQPAQAQPPKQLQPPPLQRPQPAPTKPVQPGKVQKADNWFVRTLKFFDRHNGTFNALAALAVAGFTYRLWRLSEQEIAALGQQSEDVKQSIAEAARAATAMERVAQAMTISAAAAQESVGALKERTAQQMRAYLSVVVGSGTYQEKRKNLKFAASPVLMNTGNTPAHDVRYRANAAILPLPLPVDFRFPLSKEVKGGAVLPAGQTFTMNAVVSDYIDERLVRSIKRNVGSAVFVWGVVYYRDIFDIRRRVTFCHHIAFSDDGKVTGWYYPKHNRAN